MHHTTTPNPAISGIIFASAATLQWTFSLFFWWRVIYVHLFSLILIIVILLQNYEMQSITLGCDYCIESKS